MKFSHFLFLLSLIGLVYACGTDTGANKGNDEALLKEAAEIHQEAINIGMAVAPRLSSLRQLRNNINVQGRALTPEEVSLTGAIDKIEERHKYWQSHLVEVPGHEDHHHHHDHGGHDHNHDHAPAPNLTAQQMLAVQKEIRDSIMVIRDGIEEIEGLIE